MKWLIIALLLAGAACTKQEISQGGRPMNTHYLKITYCYDWQAYWKGPAVAYAGYESKEKMETACDYLTRCGNGVVRLTREEYEAALADIKPTPAEMENEDAD